MTELCSGLTVFVLVRTRRLGAEPDGAGELSEPGFGHVRKINKGSYSFERRRSASAAGAPTKRHRKKKNKKAPFLQLCAEEEPHAK